MTAALAWRLQNIKALMLSDRDDKYKQVMKLCGASDIWGEESFAADSVSTSPPFPSLENRPHEDSAWDLFPQRLGISSRSSANALAL